MATHATSSPATSLAARRLMLAAAVVLVATSPYSWEFARLFGIWTLGMAVLAAVEGSSSPIGRLGRPTWALCLVTMTALAAVLVLLSMTLF